jgi:WD40 repeat protein
MNRALPLLLVLVLCCFAHGDAPSFRRDVAPLLQRRCAQCHSDDNQKGGYRLDTFAHLHEPGDSGDPSVTPGQPGKSQLYQLLVAPDPDDRMPQKADALPADEIALVKDWIARGAASDADRDDQPLAELARERHLRAAPGHYPRAIPVTALAFDAGAQRLATSGYHEVLVWDAAAGTLLRRVGHLPERINSLAWRGSLLAVAGGTPGQWGTVALIDTASDDRVQFLCDLPEMALSVTFSPKGDTLAAGCGDRTLRLFDLSSRSGKVFRFLGAPVAPEQRIIRHHADWVQSVAYSPNGKRLVTASRDRTARVLDPDNGELEGTYDEHDAALLAAVFAPDGSRVVTSARGGGLHLWHGESMDRHGSFTDTGGDVCQLAASPAWGIAAAGSDGILRLYQPGQKEPWLELRGHRDAITALTATPDGALLATGSADGEVRVWSPQCWECVNSFRAAP